MDGLMQFSKSIDSSYNIGDHLWLSIEDVFDTTEFIIKSEDDENYYCESVKKD